MPRAEDQHLLHGAPFLWRTVTRSVARTRRHLVAVRSRARWSEGRPRMALGTKASAERWGLCENRLAH